MPTAAAPTGIDRRIRACTPAPGAWSTHDGERLKVGPVSIEPDHPALAPRTSPVGKSSVHVGAGTVPVRLGEAQPVWGSDEWLPQRPVASARRPRLDVASCLGYLLDMSRPATPDAGPRDLQVASRGRARDPRGATGRRTRCPPAPRGRASCSTACPTRRRSTPRREMYDDLLVIVVPDAAAKEALVEDESLLFFTIDHFNGYQAVLVQQARLGEVDVEELREIITEAWASGPSRVGPQALRRWLTRGVRSPPPRRTPAGRRSTRLVERRTTCSAPSASTTPTPTWCSTRRADGLTGRDAAFATELASGTLRRLGTMMRSWPLGPSAGQGRGQGARRAAAGAHQLLSMRVPAHAAISTTVDLVRYRAGSGPAGFTECRAAARRRPGPGRVGAPGRPRPGNRPAGFASVAHAHPRWVVEERPQQWGRRSWTRRRRRGQRAAAGGAGGPSRVARPETQLPCTPTLWSPPFDWCSRARTRGSAPAVADGRAGVQDEGSQLVALGRRPGRGGAGGPAPSRGAGLERRPGRQGGPVGGPGGRAGGPGRRPSERHPHRTALVRRALAGATGSRRSSPPTAPGPRGARPNLRRGSRRRPLLRPGDGHAGPRPLLASNTRGRLRRSSHSGSASWSPRWTPCGPAAWSSTPPALRCSPRPVASRRPCWAPPPRWCSRTRGRSSRVPGVTARCLARSSSGRTGIARTPMFLACCADASV